MPSHYSKFKIVCGYLSILQNIISTVVYKQRFAKFSLKLWLDKWSYRIQNAESCSPMLSPPSAWMRSYIPFWWIVTSHHWIISSMLQSISVLTHWGRVTHIYASDLTSIDSDNGLSSGRRQAIIRTNAGILLIWPLGITFSEILIEIHIFSFKKMRSKMSSARRRPFCLGFNVWKRSLVWKLLWHCH